MEGWRLKVWKMYQIYNSRKDKENRLIKKTEGSDHHLSIEIGLFMW